MLVQNFFFLSLSFVLFLFQPVPSGFWICKRFRWCLDENNFSICCFCFSIVRLPVDCGTTMTQSETLYSFRYNPLYERCRMIRCHRRRFPATQHIGHSSDRVEKEFNNLKSAIKRYAADAIASANKEKKREKNARSRVQDTRKQIKWK